jgi:hypothetical protein
LAASTIGIFASLSFLTEPIIASSSTGMKTTASGRSLSACSTIAFCSTRPLRDEVLDFGAGRTRDLVGGDAERLIRRIGRVLGENRDSRLVVGGHGVAREHEDESEQPSSSSRFAWFLPSFYSHKIFLR